MDPNDTAKKLAPSVAGAGIGFFVAGPPGALVGAGIGALSSIIYSFVTPEVETIPLDDYHAQIFNEAVTKLKDPEKLNSLANAFDEVGKNAQADLLRKRAALRELPPDVKKARKAEFKRLLSSKDAAEVEAAANKAASEGATGQAEALRNYAQGLRKSG